MRAAMRLTLLEPASRLRFAVVWSLIDRMSPGRRASQPSTSST